MLQQRNFLRLGAAFGGRIVRSHHQWTDPLPWW